MGTNAARGTRTPSDVGVNPRWQSRHESPWNAQPDRVWSPEDRSKALRFRAMPQRDSSPMRNRAVSRADFETQARQIEALARRIAELETREADRSRQAERQMQNLDAFLLELAAHKPEPTVANKPLSIEFLRAMMDFDDE